MWKYVILIMYQQDHFDAIIAYLGLGCLSTWHTLIIKNFERFQFRTKFCPKLKTLVLEI